MREWKKPGEEVPTSIHLPQDAREAFLPFIVISRTDTIVKHLNLDSSVFDTPCTHSSQTVPSELDQMLTTNAIDVESRDIEKRNGRWEGRRYSSLVQSAYGGIIGAKPARNHTPWRQTIKNITTTTTASRIPSPPTLRDYRRPHRS